MVASWFICPHFQAWAALITRKDSGSHEPLQAAARQLDSIRLNDCDSHESPNYSLMRKGCAHGEKGIYGGQWPMTVEQVCLNEDHAEGVCCINKYHFVCVCVG